ncbi:MAG: hypothetical protein COW00_07265 [Bdellovibrio sp. CG12_big_fil_rev_8_21_14_0_65_39_13]|nr:MAG: hypothetical protein COW78_16955 [Bdellovibrio sp. CG22_combo_CG10-13_8_21_14_all_39_27]PIQ60286.1 MAG: hypothetical protein COW00_07265 [Bdellovibrio sp. CG12_big_fil_rev_8_21_14_0_65_39_13]
MKMFFSFLFLITIVPDSFAESPVYVQPFFTKSQTFINSDYYGITEPKQREAILKLKLEYLTELTGIKADAKDEDREKLLTEYQTKVGVLISKFTEENAKRNYIPPTNTNPYIMNPYLQNPVYTNGFCTPNNDQTFCQSPDGRVYKLDNSVNQLGRKLKEISDETEQITKENFKKSQDK